MFMMLELVEAQTSPVVNEALLCSFKESLNRLLKTNLINFFREMGMTTISGLLMADKQDPEPFQEAFEALVEWSWRYPDKTKVWRKLNLKIN